MTVRHHDTGASLATAAIALKLILIAGILGTIIGVTVYGIHLKALATAFAIYFTLSLIVTLLSHRSAFESIIQ